MYEILNNLIKLKPNIQYAIKYKSDMWYIGTISDIKAGADIEFRLAEQVPEDSTIIDIDTHKLGDNKKSLLHFMVVDTELVSDPDKILILGLTPSTFNLHYKADIIHKGALALFMGDKSDLADISQIYSTMYLFGDTDTEQSIYDLEHTTYIVSLIERINLVNNETHLCAGRYVCDIKAPEGARAKYVDLALYLNPNIKELSPWFILNIATEEYSSVKLRFSGPCNSNRLAKLVHDYTKYQTMIETINVELSCEEYLLHYKDWLPVNESTTIKLYLSYTDREDVRFIADDFHTKVWFDNAVRSYFSNHPNSRKYNSIIDTIIY